MRKDRDIQVAWSGREREKRDAKVERWLLRTTPGARSRARSRARRMNAPTEVERKEQRT